MSNFGETLFGSSKFIRWALSPLILLFVILMPFLITFCIEKWSLIAIIIMVGMELACIALLLGFWLPPKISHWSFRVLTGLVFVTHITIFIYVFFFSNDPLRLLGDRGEDTRLNALLGLVIVGLPCLWYSLFGRFTFRPSLEEIENDKLDDEHAGNGTD
jgi:hypothetical protein